MSDAKRTPPSPGTRRSKEDALGVIEHAFTRIVGLAEARRASSGLHHRLDRAAYSLMTQVGEVSAIRLTELASTMGIDLSTASRQVRSLEERGLVARTADPDDQRTRWLNLTEAGEAMLDDVRTLRIEGLRARLTSWSDVDLVGFARLLERFIDSFEHSLTDGESQPNASDCGDLPAQSLAAGRAPSQPFSVVGGTSR